MEPKVSRPRFPGYGITESRDGLLPWSWAAERLAASRNYWISTTRPDGRPHAMPVWGVWVDDTLYFGSGRESRKARNLRASPEVVAHVESGDEVVIIEGVAEEVIGDEAAEPVNQAYERKYAWRAEAGDPSPLYAVRPRRAFAWREKDYPTSATRFDF
jgi:PPOX class probable F420-dependent enzyme